MGACGDVGYWIRSGIDPIDAARMLKDRLITLQVHDLNESSEDAHDVAWGTGATNLKNFIREIKSMNINPILFGLEYSYNWGNSLPDIKKSAEFFNTLSIELAAK